MGQTSVRTNIQLVYHFGAPHSENSQLIPSLRKNTDLLERFGVHTLRPRKFKRAINALRKELAGEVPSAAQQSGLLDILVGDLPVDRLVMSDSQLIGDPAWMLSGGQFYRNAYTHTQNYRAILPDNPCEFFIGISNPAILLPLAFENQSARTLDRFYGNTDLGSIRWSNVISKISAANPDVNITVWCNEDTPILWPTILNEVAGLQPQVPLLGEMDIVERIMSADGFARLVRYLGKRPELNELQIRRVKSKFLEKYFLERAVDIEINLPDWNDELVTVLTDLYEDDLEIIESIPRVSVISP